MKSVSLVSTDMHSHVEVEGVTKGELTTLIALGGRHFVSMHCDSVGISLYGVARHRV